MSRSATVTSAIKDPPLSPARTLEYTPRRSTRVAGDFAQADGDTWREKLAVCEQATDEGLPKLLVRSYFRNERTGERVWDEPPSGASNILHATQEARNNAEAQLQELKLTLEMIPPDETERNDSKNSSSPKKKGFFSRFGGGGGKKKEKKQIETAKDLNLQRAIARSMMDQFGSNKSSVNKSESPLIYYDDDAGAGATFQSEDEALELAKALSLSDAASADVRGGMQRDTSLFLTEEEQFQLAIEESRREASQNGGSGVASLHDPMESFFGSNHTVDKPDEYDGADQKMSPKKPAATSISMFDPYSPSSVAKEQFAAKSASHNNILDLPSLNSNSPQTSEPKDEEKDEPKSPTRARLRMFGGKKKLEEDAGVV